MWKCIACGEQIEDDFDICWNCQTSKDGKPPEILSSAPLPKELESLRERFSKSFDEELLRIVNVDFEQYGEETIILAKTELARRNLLEANEEDWNKLMEARAELVQPDLPIPPEAKLCSHCKAILEDDAKFCAECRTPVIKDSLLECPNCKKDLSLGSKFCKYCAAEITPQAHVGNYTSSPQRTKANKLATSGAILAIVSALAFLWGQNYTSNWANTARAGFGNLIGQQDSVYQLAQYCIILGALGFIVGVVLFIVGLSQR